MRTRVIIVGIVAVTAAFAGPKPLSCGAILKLPSGDSKIMEIVSAWDRCKLKWKPGTADADLDHYLRDLSTFAPELIRQKWSLFAGMPYQRRIQEVYVNRLLDAGASLSDLRSVELHIMQLRMDRALVEQSARASDLDPELRRLDLLYLQKRIERAAQTNDVEALRALASEARGTPLESQYNTQLDSTYARVWRVASTSASLEGICRHLPDPQDEMDCYAKQRHLDVQERLSRIRYYPWNELLTYRPSFRGTEAETEFNSLLQNRLTDCAEGACSTPQDLAGACPNITDAAIALHCRARLGDLTLADARHSRAAGNLTWLLVSETVERCAGLSCAPEAAQLEWTFTSSSVLARIENEDAQASRRGISKQAWLQVLLNLQGGATRRFGGQEPLETVAPELKARLISHYYQAQSLGNSLTSQVGTAFYALQHQVSSGVSQQARDAWIRRIDDLRSQLDYAFGLDRDQTWPAELRVQLAVLREQVVDGDFVATPKVHVEAPKMNFWFIMIDKGVQVLLGLDPDPISHWALLVAWEHVKQFIIGRDDVTNYKLAFALPDRRRYLGLLLGDLWTNTTLNSTASTSFANPAVTFARSLTNTSAGFTLRMLVVSSPQLLGATVATLSVTGSIATSSG